MGPGGLAELWPLPPGPVADRDEPGTSDTRCTLTVMRIKTHQKNYEKDL